MANEPLTQWHPAFCSAIKLELLENKNDLTYTEELGLNSKPIRIDLLVITKSPDVIINNDIGKIFRGHNIFEYKSPDDELNIDVFYKGVAYASLYKANGPNVDAIKADDIKLIEKAYFYKSLISKAQGSFSQAEMYMNLSLDALLKFAGNHERYERYLAMGNMYYEIGEHNDSIKYFSLALGEEKKL